MRAALLLLLVLAAGCATPTQPKIGGGDVPVPKHFHPYLNWVDQSPSDYERYLSMYRQGYWDCAKMYAKDINYIPQKSDTYASGWGSEIEGYADGYIAAEKDVNRNIKQFGRARVSPYLKEIFEGNGL